LSFKNNFNTEPIPTDATGAYDGGVLAISIAGGSFSDITAVGGSFVSGGYTRTIRTTENPLNGRAAWAGASGGFTNTVVKLPASAAGQTVRFKWRFGFDNGNAYGGTGWYIDSITVRDGYACCTGAPPATLASAGLTVNSTKVSLLVSNSVSGLSYTLEYKNSLSDPSWTPVPGVAVGNGAAILLQDTNAPGPSRFYRISSQ
jgi:hypothetical protein